MSELTLRGHYEQILLVCATRYAIGRSTYMPSLVAGVLSKHIDEMDPGVAALLARTIREEWCHWFDEGAKPKHNLRVSIYDSDWGCFVDLLPRLDERAGDEPLVPLPLTSWADVPADVRPEGVVL